MSSSERQIVRPDISNLRGRIGRSIIETIRNTPAPDRTAMDMECRKMEREILAAEENDLSKSQEVHTND